MVSRIGAWFNKKFVAKTNQPGENDDGPSGGSGEEDNGQQDFTGYSG